VGLQCCCDERNVVPDTPLDGRVRCAKLKQFAAQTLDVSTSRLGDNGVGITYATVLGYREVILCTCLCQSQRTNICTCCRCIITRHDGQCTFKRNIEARSRNHSYRGRAKVLYILCVCVCVCVCVAIVVEHAKRMRRIILSVA
jgi:hypothetical protein